MRQTILTIALLGLICGGTGCGSQPQWDPAVKQDLFKPASMRIHPVFTQVRDWTTDGKPDGVEALIEFQDQFGDPAKASGNMVFEIFAYRPGYPDPRGNRLVNPFLASVENIAAQRDHWNRTSRCYSFQLAWPDVRAQQTYVLTATCELAGGGRFTDMIVLEPLPKEPAGEQPATRPVKQPGVRSLQP